MPEFFGIMGGPREHPKYYTLDIDSRMRNGLNPMYITYADGAELSYTPLILRDYCTAHSVAVTFTGLYKAGELWRQSETLLEYINMVPAAREFEHRVRSQDHRQAGRAYGVPCPTSKSWSRGAPRSLISYMLDDSFPFHSLPARWKSDWLDGEMIVRPAFTNDKQGYNAPTGAEREKLWDNSMRNYFDNATKAIEAIKERFLLFCAENHIHHHELSQKRNEKTEKEIRRFPSLAIGDLFGNIF